LKWSVFLPKGTSSLIFGVGQLGGTEIHSFSGYWLGARARARLCLCRTAQLLRGLPASRSLGCAKRGWGCRSGRKLNGRKCTGPFALPCGICSVYFPYAIIFAPKDHPK